MNPDEEKFVLANKLITERKRLKMSQAKLAEKAGLSRVVVNQLENGASNATLTTLIAVAKALNLVIDFV